MTKLLQQLHDELVRRQYSRTTMRSSSASLSTFEAVPTDILHFCRASCRHLAPALAVVFEELRAVRERPMMVSMPTTARPQQRHDHRLRHLVQRTGDVTIATDLGVPRSTARLAGHGTDSRGLLGWCRPHGAGAPAGSGEAPAARPEAHGAAAAGAGAAPNLRVSPQRSASA